MQHVRNSLIIFLTNSLKNNINFVKTKIVINLKNRGPRSKLPHWTKIIYSYVKITCTNKKKVPVHDHMTHVVKIDTLNGHEDMGNLHLF